MSAACSKSLTGRDPITAGFLHKEFFTEPVAKFWLATNAKPQVRYDSEGFWRRVHLIPFTQSFVGREDKTLKDRLRAEASGILNWLVRGCLAWQSEGLNPGPVDGASFVSRYGARKRRRAQLLN
jgi:putative DNA primase/helicase